MNADNGDLTPDDLERLKDCSHPEIMASLIKSWRAMRPDPNCPDCGGTGWFDNEGCVGRCDCLPEEQRFLTFGPRYKHSELD